MRKKEWKITSFTSLIGMKDNDTNKIMSEVVGKLLHYHFTISLPWFGERKVVPLRRDILKRRIDMEARAEARNYQQNSLITQLGSLSDNYFKDPAMVHREQCWDFILHDAAPWHREHLTRLARLWDHWNAEFFDGAFQTRPHILLAATSTPDAYGDYARTGGWGGKAQIRIRESLLRGTHPDVRKGEQFVKGRFLFVADVLLHECIHQYQHEILGIERTNSYVAHGPTFREKANEIGEKIGLPPVRASRKRGKDEDLASCAQWPHCVRPEGYYLGAYTPGGNGSRARASVSLEQELRRLLKKWSKQEILDALQVL